MYMKAKIVIAIFALSAVALYAQQQPSTAGRASAAAQKQAQAAAKPADSQAKPETAAKPEEKKDAAKPKVTSAGKRDPFVSPVIQQKQLQSIQATCGTGKRCLVIDQLNVQGVVESANGNIAVVTNSAKRAYFLRENDALFNGHVQRINADSIVFIETVLDRLGRPSTREVVKRVNPGPA
jgi:Tfp pilus assembly protein PilP